MYACSHIAVRAHQICCWAMKDCFPHQCMIPISLTVSINLCLIWYLTLYTNYRSNHLNGPDYDSLETSSVASGSSAYSSKEDSLSPTLGSVTELSDVGSVDSFLEYDIQRNKVRTIAWMLHNVTGPLPDLIGKLTVQSTFAQTSHYSWLFV